jgi:hypothetical protein
MRRFFVGYMIVGALSTLLAGNSDLPADLQQIKFTATGTLSASYALVHLFVEKGYKGYALVDSTGRIAWHYRTKDYPFGADRRKNGNFVFMDKGHGLVEVDRAGSVVNELRQRDPEREMHHAIVVTPRDTVLYLAFDTEVFNGKPLKGEAIWEWNPDTGEDVKRWRSWKSIEWRLGGVRPTIAVPPEQQTSAQHTAAEIAPNRVLMFDNRTALQPPYSRAVEYVIEGNTARQVWEWRPRTHDNYAAAVSSARRLPNGNTLIGFGMVKGRNGSSGPTEAFEVTTDGTVAWHLVVDGVMTLFRVEPVTSFEP